MTFIPQIEPWIDSQELKYLKEAIKSTYVTENALTQRFELRIQELTGAKHVISMCNGTAALYCCLKALGIGPGDEVIVPNLTFIATANAVIMAGATPVFCDVTDTFSIDLDSAKKCRTAKTKAILPVHLYGLSADIQDIIWFARDYNLKVIEDAAQGVGVKYNGVHVGTLGDMGILSFYGNKTITCGEGGVVLTNDSELAEKCYKLKNHGRKGKGVFIHDTIGFNFCFTEMQAAVGLAQLDKLPDIIERKQAIYDRYMRELDLKPIIIPVHTTPVHWFTSFLVPNRPRLKYYLLSKDIQTREFFYPLDWQPCYNNMTHKVFFDNSHRLYEQGISLPSSCNLTSAQQGRVIREVKNFYDLEINDRSRHL